MSDLDDLEELARLPEKSGRKLRSRWRTRGEIETHCKRGHELTPENTFVYPDGRRRDCLKCKRLRLLCREDS